jgi:spore coat polysaccharide biosynthesis protein SpsF
MKVVAIVQARTGSTRLPGKVLQDLAGQSMLSRVIDRLRASHLIDQIVVATTCDVNDDVIVEECDRCSVSFSRGDEGDVLDRYYRTAKSNEADVVVRITSDCPLLDPTITDKIIQAFLQERPDYASNTISRTYPRGLDTEVIAWNALARAWQQAGQLYEREHVTPYIIENPTEFKLLSVTGDQDYSGYRWTVDTPEDLAFVRAVYSRFPTETLFSWSDVLGLLEREPALADLNRSVVQKAIR